MRLGEREAMSEKGPSGKYVVTLKTTCTMLVEVEASSAAEAKRLAREGEYEPVTEWQPVSYDDLRATETNLR